MRFTLAMAGASAAILGTLGMGLPSQALAEPVVLEPQSPWSMDFGDTRCRLARLFGEEDDKHIVIFDQFGPGNAFLLTLAGSSYSQFKGREDVWTHFNSEQQPFKNEAYMGDLGSYGEALVFSSSSLTERQTDAEEEPSAAPEQPDSPALEQLDVETAKAARFVHVRQGDREVRLRTGPMGDAFTLLNQCTQGLIESWGLDADAHLTMQRLPEWLNEKQIAKKIARRYPERALMNGESGVVNLRVKVSETGSVTECVVENVTETRILQSPACETMRRARFEPALDAEGKPMESFYQTRITYRAN